MRAKRIVVFLLLACLLVSTLQMAAASDWYTYSYNFWKEEVESPDAYSVTNTLFGADWEEVGNFKDPQGLFCVGDSVFVCDTGNNRIVEFIRKDGAYEFVRIIYSVNVSKNMVDALQVKGNITLTLNNPMDIFVMPMTAEQREEAFGTDYIGDPYEVQLPEKEEEPGEGNEEGTPGENGDETPEENGDEAPEENGDEVPEGGADESVGSSSEEDTDEGSDGEGSDGDGEGSDGDGEGSDGEGEGADGEGSDGNGEGSEDSAPIEYKENVIGQDLNLDYDFYIADYKNNRVLHCDYNMNVIGVIANPKDDTLSEKYEFLPGKLVVDTAFRLYVQATGINSGLMEFDKSGDFTSYVGANKVEANIVEKIWRKIQTQEQKNRTVQFVPTEYNNLSLDSKGFIYVTTHTLDDDDIWAGTATPVRKLNSMGSDILVRNGNAYPIGDLTWGTANEISGASRFIDVIAFNNDTYACLDRMRGRIFVYDFQGNMLYAFGNVGMLSGRFVFPAAMDNPDEETILVLDQRSGGITEFSMTNYGRLINKALDEYKVGKYDDSADTWKEVLKFNGNNELAYVGIGRALLRNNQYKEAMGYFKVARDEVNYSKAFRHYREEVVEQYIGYALAILAVLIIVPKVVRRVKKLRKEIREA